MKRKILCLIIVIILSFVSVVLSNSLYNKINFVPSSTNIDSQGYYNPHGILGLWRIHHTQPCIGPKWYCTIGPECPGFGPNVPSVNPNSTNASGWPVLYNYSTGVCAPPNLYLPIAIIIDFIFYASIFSLLYFGVAKT